MKLSTETILKGKYITKYAIQITTVIRLTTKTTRLIPENQTEITNIDETVVLVGRNI